MDTYAENGSNVFAVSVAKIIGQQWINGVLFGTKWNGQTITYSAPDSLLDYPAVSYPELTGFHQFTAQQLATAHKSLNADLVPNAAAGFTVEGFTNLDINYIGSGSGLGTIRYANNSVTPTAVGFFPTASFKSGDVFCGPSSGTNPVVGNYDYFTIMHETGHALGLKHGHEAGTFGALPLDGDSMEFSIMTYRSFIGSDAKFVYNESFSFPQTYMQDDIAALQYLYGADFTTRAENTTYSWDTFTGQTFVNGAAAITPGANRIFTTIWDGGGVDTYNLSNYATNLDIDLSPGGHSTFSDTQRAYLGGNFFSRGEVFNALQYQNDPRSLIENVIGGTGNDTIHGNAADNTLNGGAGSDILRGDAGLDTSVYSKPVDAYHFGYRLGGFVVDGTDVDVLQSIERLTFSNLTLDIADRSKVDPLYYLEQNRDVATAGIDPLTHYKAHGWTEGRDPNPDVHLATFESLDYIASYSDLIAALGPDAQAGHDHFASHGLFEGRTVNFDDMEYIASYTDLIAAFRGSAAIDSGSDVGAEHYILWGHDEGRVTDRFDAVQYLANYADIQAAFGSDLHLAAWHYVVAGYFEGRTDT